MKFLHINMLVHNKVFISVFIFENLYFIVLGFVNKDIFSIEFVLMFNLQSGLCTWCMLMYMVNPNGSENIHPLQFCKPYLFKWSLESSQKLNLMVLRLCV